ncbi:MAG: hypothetical protein NWE99_03720 [Candidatus Bathyarchaeota archaeon]|nr:hypothetical protein [Candidatus Bathyarchaeota archaeon]
MVKPTKSQRLREKIRTDVKYSKQSTLGDLPKTHKVQPTNPVAPKPPKKIEITEVNTSTREDELVMEVAFRLLPSRASFSRITADLYFDDQKIESLHLRILQGPLASDESEFSSVLNMTGIVQGQHILRVEMHDFWCSGEKLASASKEVAIEYFPVRREDRLIRVPIVKSSASADLAIISEMEKSIYREIEKEMKRESACRRDRW